MENVGIYTPPQKAKPAVSGGSDVFNASLTLNELEVTSQHKISCTKLSPRLMKTYHRSGYISAVVVAAVCHMA